MRKSNQSLQGNVVQFMKKTEGQRSAAPMSRSKQANPGSKSRKLKFTGKVLTPPSQAQTERQLHAMSQKGNPTPERVDELVPGTIRHILRRVGSGNASETRLSRYLQRRVDLLCSFNHPVGLILKDWLDGKRKCPPANFETIAEHSTCVQHSPCAQQSSSARETRP